jgi:hypothetical protein
VNDAEKVKHRAKAPVKKRINALHRYLKRGICRTPDRKPKLLIVVVSVYIAVIVVHVPVPGVIGIVLSSTPPVTVVANIVECSIIVTVATRKGCKSNLLICCTSICSQYNLL